MSASFEIRQSPVLTPHKASRLPRLLWPMALLALLVSAALDTKVVRIGSQQDTRVQAFSAEAYGKKAFPAIQAEIEKNAVEAKTLAAAIAEDKAAAGEKYGKPGSVGPIFPVRFSGVAGEVRSGIVTVKVDGLPEGLQVRVQTGRRSMAPMCAMPPARSASASSPTRSNTRMPARR